jgi:hypothetical protein
VTGERPDLSASSGAKTATSTNRIRITRPIMPMGLSRKVFHVRFMASRRRAHAIFFGSSGIFGALGSDVCPVGVSSVPAIYATLTRGSR